MSACHGWGCGAFMQAWARVRAWASAPSRASAAAHWVALLVLFAASGAAVAQECASTSADASSVRVEYDAALSAAGGAGAVTFQGTPDGSVRAVEERSERVLGTFTPPEAAGAATRTGLITNLSVLRFDANNDGRIVAGDGDRVWLYFGLRRAGPYYYALDVTDRNIRPLWRTGADTLEGLGDAWSAPTIARVRVGGATQNGEHFVLVLGGGLGDGGAGNRLFIVDAADGRLLWSAGDGEDVDRALPSMTQPIAARVAAIDLDGDEYADRLYAADVGGRVWRFDIWNGRPREELITGGVFASLGSVPPLRAPATDADARRFFNAPDVALVLPRGQAPWISLSLGSGDASDPGATGVSERFYSLRDGQAFTRLSQAAYETLQPIFDDDLIDIAADPAGTALPEGSPGWKLPLEGKVVAGSVTANGVVLFTTYTPAATGTERCEEGIGAVYALTIEGGQAALDLDNDGEVTVDDLSAVLEEPGVPPSPRIEITPPSDRDAPDEPDAPPSPGDTPTSSTRCYVGDERLTACIALGTLKRTFWKRTLVN